MSVIIGAAEELCKTQSLEKKIWRGTAYLSFLYPKKSEWINFDIYREKQVGGYLISAESLDLARSCLDNGLAKNQNFNLSYRRVFRSSKLINPSIFHWKIQKYLGIPEKSWQQIDLIFSADQCISYDKGCFLRILKNHFLPERQQMIIQTFEVRVLKEITLGYYTNLMENDTWLFDAKNLWRV